ncbi:hypothetical protein, partial [Neisseria iguanae]
FKPLILAQGFHLLPNLLPVVSLYQGHLENTAKTDKTPSAIVYPPATADCFTGKVLVTGHHT